MQAHEYTIQNKHAGSEQICISFIFSSINEYLLTTGIIILRVRAISKINLIWNPGRTRSTTKQKASKPNTIGKQRDYIKNKG